MLSWLKSVRPLLASLPRAEVTVVLGNMACDLDSGVCSLVLAHHRAVSGKQNVIPVFNIPSQDFPLKTELVAALAAEKIHAEDLIFRDQLDLSNIEKLQVILVDHNALADQDKHLEDKVVEIIDHHVRETAHTNSIIEPVGSCSSLVLRQILQENPDFADLTSVRLIHKTILLDTTELRPDAKKVTELDIEMVEKCESILGDIDIDRHQIYEALQEEKRRVNHLNAYQLLRRDFKTLSDNNIKVCLSSVPMLAKSWSDLPDLEKHLGTFLAQGDFAVLLVLGSSIKDDQITKDLIVTGDDQCPVFTAIVKALQSNSAPNLELEKDRGVTEMLRFSQGNTGASRKQILPIVKSALCLSQSSK